MVDERVSSVYKKRQGATCTRMTFPNPLIACRRGEFDKRQKLTTARKLQDRPDPRGRQQRDGRLPICLLSWGRWRRR